MRDTSRLALAAMIAVAWIGLGAAQTAERKPAKPTSETQPPQQAEPSKRTQPDPGEAQRRRPPETAPSGHAQPRSEAPAKGEAPPQRADSPPQQRAQPRPPGPPPRAVPPHYYGYPRAYYFPPVSLQRGYYYHPYFGFYYGPYYGPFYPYPGPLFGPLPFSASAIRTRVKPVETQVYINGYYAGIVDDFDGVFQRLYLPAGQHELELHLDGYRSYRQRLYVAPGDTLEIAHQMQPLGPGELNEQPPATQALSSEWTSVSPPVGGDRPASPFGILAVRVEPADAQVFVDDEAWLTTEGQGLQELVIHADAGWHRLEIRREGYQTFRTEVDLAEGATTRLNVKLMR